MSDRDLVDVAKAMGEPLLLELDEILVAMPAQPAPDSLTVAVDGCRALLWQAHQDAADLDALLSQVAVATQSPEVWTPLRRGLLDLVDRLHDIPAIEAGTATASMVTVLVQAIDGRRLDHEVAESTFRSQLDELG